MEMIGRRIGSWVLERELGRGGMGAVFLGRHAKLGTPAAVKALTLFAGGDPELRRRFEREAEVHAGLRHPHIARVFDFLDQGDTWFLVLEYLPGGSLADRPREEPVPVERTVCWIRQALAGLGHAHAHGVVHRDVKPANLMLDEHGRVKVSDFGIARSSAGVKLTCTGTALGTVQYMSPEQLETPERVDHRTDLYAAGAVLYELLAGEAPFPGETPSQVLRARLLNAWPPPLPERRPDLDPRLAEVVRRALSPDPGHRPADAEELRLELAPFEDPAASRAADRTLAAAPPPAAGTVLWNATAPTRDPFAPPPSANPARRRRLALAASALLAALLAAVGAAYHFSSADRNVLDLEAEEREERLTELVTEAREWAGQAVAAAGEASQAAQRARKTSADARSAFDRVVSALDPAGAARAAQDSVRSAQASGEAAQAAAKAAERAGDAAHSAGELAGRVHVLMAARRGPLPGVFVLATIPPASGSDGYAALADEAAERALDAAQTAKRSAEEARVEAESAQRAATESRAALDRPGPQGLPEVPGEGLPGGEQLAHADLDIPSELTGPSLPPRPAPRRPPMLPQAPTLPPMPPDQPVVAVLAPGDAVFGAPLEEALGQRLLRAGFDVRDPRGVPGVDRLLRDRGADAATEKLGRLLAEDGFHVLVVAPVEIAERENWRLGGSEGSISLGQVRLNAYLLPADRRLGRGWREKVEYSELNAAVKAERALLGATGELVGEIRAGWSGYREQVAALRGGGP